jgi:hypothetical protein
MERLPYIDEYATEVAAAPHEVWQALATTMRRELGGELSKPLAALLDVEPAAASGDFARPDVREGQAIPGFAVAQAEAPRVLAFEGRHRFSRYRLTFLLDATDGTATRVRAQTHAAFPGAAGSVYRAAVIGTRGHRLVVRRILRKVRREAAG